MSDTDTFPSGVISMEKRHLKPLRQIEDYWQRLADEIGGIPLRDRVDPRGIQDSLEFAFLAQRIAPGMARVRVAGSHLGDLMGMEVAGLPLTSFLMPESRHVLTDRAEMVWEEPAALHVTMRAAEGLGRGPLTAHLLLLPLTSDQGLLDRALGGLVTVGRIGRTPRRFVIDAIRAEPLAITSRPRPMPTPAEPMLPAGFAEEPVPFSHRPASGRPRRRAPHLRLVVSND